MRAFRAAFLVLIFSGAAHAAVLRASDLYRTPMQPSGGFAVWIVDGSAVRREIYPEFLYGGNGERYPFIPPHEIWIDHAISVEEYLYTLEHELLERDLMARLGMSYDSAHDKALELELALRHGDENASNAHEWVLHRVAPIDCDGLKEIPTLGDSIELHGIYRADLGMRDSLRVWIVDGPLVRRTIFPDFGFSGNDLAYLFIPRGEIWIDNSMAVEELETSILSEIEERREMASGVPYDFAYDRALKKLTKLRRAQRKAAGAHPALRWAPPLERDYGTGSERD